MSKIAQYLEKKNALKELEKEIEDLQSSPELKAEIEFKDNLEKLMENHGITPSSMLRILESMDPSLTKGQVKGKRGSRTRPLLTYKNPHTGEIVKTRGGNHKTLNEWRSHYGKDTVDGWKESD